MSPIHMNYEELLDQAIEKMPESVHERERFEIPKVKGHLEGNKTVLSNLAQIAGTLKRPIDHMFKFLLKELASPGTIKGQRAIFGAKFPSVKINEKIRKYAEELVLCKECGKPETTLKSDGNIVKLTCQACGTTYQVKTKI